MVDIFCTKCGASLESNNNFCTKCGFKISTTQTENTLNEQYYEKKKSNRKGSKKIIIIGIVFFVFVLFVGAIFLGSQSDNIVNNEKSMINMIEEKDPMRFDGLTSEQITHVRLIEDECERQSGIASLSGETAERIYSKRCNQVIEDKINEFTYANTVKKSIETHDVSLCDKVQDNLLCIKEYALAVNEPEVCVGAGNIEESCINEIAKNNDQIDTCNLLKDNTNCITQFAYDKKDHNLCELATNQGECVKQFALSTDASSCILLSGNDIDLCYEKFMRDGLENSKSISDFSSNDKYNECVQWESNSIKNAACKLEVLGISKIPKDKLLSFSEDGELTVCKIMYNSNMDTSQKYDYCMASLGVALNDLSICNQSGIAIPECYSIIAQTNDIVNVDDCDTLGDGRAHCYLGVAVRIKDPNLCTTEFDPSFNFEDNCKSMIRHQLEWEAQKEPQNCELGVYTQYCMNKLAETGVSLCDNMKNEYSKSMCIEEYNSRFSNN